MKFQMDRDIGTAEFKDRIKIAQTVELLELRDDIAFDTRFQAHLRLLDLEIAERIADGLEPKSAHKDLFRWVEITVVFFTASVALLAIAYQILLRILH